jgi:hypothetical protein
MKYVVGLVVHLEEEIGEDELIFTVADSQEAAREVRDMLAAKLGVERIAEE